MGLRRSVSNRRSTFQQEGEELKTWENQVLVISQRCLNLRGKNDRPELKGWGKEPPRNRGKKKGKGGKWAAEEGHLMKREGGERGSFIRVLIL